MANTVFRLIGETDIVDIDPVTVDANAHPKLMGLDDADWINLLGHWLDQDRGEDLQDEADFKSAMTVIGAALAPADQPNGINFTVITILREKWPVGSKAGFHKIANRVGAEHTYVVHVCTGARHAAFDDEAMLKQSETTQLVTADPHYRKHRKP